MKLPAPILAVLDVAVRLAQELPAVQAVGLAGSWARGAGRPDSDVDLVVLTVDPAGLLGSTSWSTIFDHSAVLVRSASFGSLDERRLLLPTGLVVEVCIGLPSWAATQPVDAGTRRVVSDGFLALSDRTGLLRAVMDAVSTDAAAT